MGQYFKAVNLDKREYVCPWCLCGGAKLFEWASGPHGSIFTLLLRKSDATGGGDYGGQAPQEVHLTATDSIGDLVAKGLAREGMPMLIPSDSIVGRWAGDRIALVGDYDQSRLYDEAKRYRNISQLVVETWNRFVEAEQMQLEFNDDCCRLD